MDKINQAVMQERTRIRELVMKLQEHEHDITGEIYVKRSDVLAALIPK